jgi:hypothetical protein
MSGRRLTFLNVMLDLALLSLLIFIAPYKVEARSQFLENLGKGAERRYENRWTLADYFETQRKTRLQDMWLVGNTDNEGVIELMLGGRSANVPTRIDQADAPPIRQQLQAEGAAYATLVGLEGRYIDVEGEGFQTWGLFAFRPLGNSLQNSHLTLFYGLRKEVDRTEVWRTQMAGGRLQIYLNQAFGLEGQYYVYLPEDSNAQARLEGQLTEGGAFIDFLALRVFGTWSREVRRRTPTGGLTSERTREAVFAGVKIFI